MEFYPTIGNHDVFEGNMEDFEKESADWMVTHLATIWHDEQWLSEAEAHQVLKFGYYSKPMKFNPKGKVIALNTNGAYEFNWKLLANRYDPGKMLEWLENELDTLEKDHGFAYIIGHVPPYHFLH
jgi:hypothetical protein